MPKKAKKPGEPLKARGVRLSDEMWASLGRLAAESDRDHSYVIRSILSKFLDAQKKP